MNIQRLNNSSTTARYRFSFNDLREMETTGTPEMVARAEPMNYGYHIVDRHEDGQTVDIFIG